jgi:4'-phosphopantetheinyl transferase
MTDNRVTVWTMQVGTPSPAVLARWQAILDAEEKAQAARFRSDTDRHTYIAAHALTRALLAFVGGQPASSWQFNKTEKGKPEIIGTDLQFSLSHTMGLVACAVARGFAVGIDTEYFDRKQKQADLAQAVLTPHELSQLKSFPAEQHQETFLRFWTLREAYVKATGQGISFPREDFAFVLDQPSICFANGDDASHWQFCAWEEKRHVISLAANRDQPLELVKRSVTEDEIP